MFHWLKRLLPSLCKTPLRSSCRPCLELLEGRWLPSTMIVLDFDGASETDVNAVTARLGGIPTGEGESFPTFTSFIGEFQNTLNADYARYQFLDYNGDGVLNATDGNRAATQILNWVRENFSPFDVRVVREDNTSRALNLLRSNDGNDTLTFVDGAVWGGHSGIDGGNTHDDVNWAGAVKPQADTLADTFGWAGVAPAVSGAARELFALDLAIGISHEVGHSFGLEHIDDPFAGSSSIMTGVSFRNAVFADRDYRTEGGSLQNEYLYLNRVLGPSPNPWAAVLSPGVLTIQGSDREDIISVVPEPGGTGDWSVNMLSPRGIEEHHVDPSATPDASSLNPYGMAINTIRFNGGDANDIFRVAPSISADVEAAGGKGNDQLYTGGGNDQLSGGSGNDVLDAGAGIDLLNGDAGNDTLIGGPGDDSQFGGIGNDELVGNEQDYLDGGDHRDTYEIQFAGSPARGNLTLNIHDTGTRGEDSVVLLGTDIVDQVSVQSKGVSRFLGLVLADGSTTTYVSMYHTVAYDGIERLRVRTLGGRDQITVESTRSHIDITLQGGNDNDTITVAVDGLLSHLNVLGGSGGHDTLVLNDAADHTPDQVTVTPDQVGAGVDDNFFAPGVLLDYDNIERVELYMGNAEVGDTIWLTPSRLIEFFVHGNSPLPVPAPPNGDMLHLNLDGVTNPAFHPGAAPGAGSWTFGNRRGVSFESIERMTPNGDLLPVPIPPGDPLPPPYPPLPLPPDDSLPPLYPPLPLPPGDPLPTPYPISPLPALMEFPVVTAPSDPLIGAETIGTIGLDPVFAKR